MLTGRSCARGAMRIAHGRFSSFQIRWCASMPNRTAANQSAPTHQSSPTPSSAVLSIKQGQTEWHLDPTKSTLPELQHRDTLLKPADVVSTMLLPRGYPHTVSHGYVGYTSWLAAGLFAHSFTVMVSTNALLSGFFAEMSAASWLMKDLLPPLLAGTLASRIHSLEASPHLVDLRARASPPRRVSAHLPLRRTRRSGCRPPALRTRCSAAPSSSSRTCCPRRPGWGSPS